MWEAPRPHFLPPRLPPGPQGECTGRRRGWNGGRSSKGAPQNPCCCSPRQGPAGHSLRHPWDRPTPWPSALTKRGTAGVEVGEEVRRVMSGSEEGTVRVPEDRSKDDTKVQKCVQECVLLCVFVGAILMHVRFRCQENQSSFLLLPLPVLPSLSGSSELCLCCPALAFKYLTPSLCFPLSSHPPSLCLSFALAPVSRVLCAL